MARAALGLGAVVFGVACGGGQSRVAVDGARACDSRPGSAAHLGRDGGGVRVSEGSSTRWIRNVAEAYTLRGAGLGLARTVDIVIEDGLIAAILPADANRVAPAGVEVVDASGLLALPGLVDGHNHLWQVLIRGCGADLHLPEWLAHCVFPWRAVPPTFQESYALTRFAAAELIASGVTTVVDWNHSFGAPMVEGALAALRDSGLRFRLAVFPALAAQPSATRPGGLAASERSPARRAPALDPAWVTLVEKLAASFSQLGAPERRRGGLHLATHPPLPEGWDAGHLRATAALAQRLALPLNLHFHEHPSEVRADNLAELEASGAPARPLLLNHAVHLSPADLQTLARWRSGGGHTGQSDATTGVIYNPQSNARLGSGVMPLAALQAAGVPVGLGLDGAAGDRFDAFANLRMALGLQRAGAAHMLEVEAGLRLATLGGARALGLSAHIGTLEAGKAADLLLVDPQSTHFAFTRGTAELVLTAGPESVTWVFVEGRPLKAPPEAGLALESLVHLRKRAATAARALHARKSTLQAKDDADP